MRSALRGIGVLLTCACLAAVTVAGVGSGFGAGVGSGFGAGFGGAARARPSLPRHPVAAVVAGARADLGRTYAWGATGPKTFDCSGLTSTLWKRFGGVTDMPRVSRDQQAWAIPIPRNQARAGDLAFFGAPVTHTGLIMGHNRLGQLVMIDASATRKRVVQRVVWASGVVRFGRVPRPGMTPVAPWQVSRPTPPPTPAVLRARRFVALAKHQIGAKTWTDVQLVAVLWRRSGGATLRTTLAGLRSVATPVPPAQRQVGDLVLYGAPFDHVGIYIGRGLMVDASHAVGKVVVRPIWAAKSLSYARL